MLLIDMKIEIFKADSIWKKLSCEGNLINVYKAICIVVW